jgi:hypothetical protein
MRSKLSPTTGASLLTAAPQAADPPSTGPALATAVTGACWFVDLMTGEPVDGTMVDGTFTVTGFRASSGLLQVTGTLTGSCTADDSTGPTFTQEGTTSVITTVAPAAGSCLTLCLRIGAVALDRRGLVLRTDEAMIAVTAESGPRHLLGNLIGAVGNALSSGAPAEHVADLLNHIVAISG